MDEQAPRKRIFWFPIFASIALLTLVAAIALPNLRASILRSRQKRTMSDMRSIGTAMGSYQVEFNRYPDVKDLEELAKVLEPNYIDKLPRTDGWGEPWRLEYQRSEGHSVSYTLVSPGSDRKVTGWKQDLIRYFDCDIIYNDGQFVQSPEGIKKSSDERILRVLDLDSRRSDVPEADSTWAAVAARHQDAARIGAAAVRMMDVKAPSTIGSRAAMVARFERDLAADTVRNEYLFHADVHRWFAESVPPTDARALDGRVYDELFRAPATDSWAGLAPRSLDRTPHRWLEARAVRPAVGQAAAPMIVPASYRPAGSARAVPVSRRIATKIPLALAEVAAGPDDESARAAIAALRRLGEIGLDGFLSAHGDDVAQAGAVPAAERTREQERLLDALDAVAAQKDAFASRLFWYTDLAEARAAAAATGRPILSLRMLGKLDEELSCANSRFFRTTLYPDEAISRELREAFVLHWHSVRPVPKVSIDFGDGRVLRQTIAGNSAHYVLDAAGRPLDALPGMYGPGPFLAWLRSARALAGRVASAPDDARAVVLRSYHRDRLAVLGARWQAAIDGLAGGQRAAALQAGARAHRELAAEARPEDAGALDRAVYDALGLPLEDACLGLTQEHVFTGIDETVERPVR